jgi:hypothetical protein
MTDFEHKSALLERILFLFAVGLLFIDSATGFFSLKLGIDIKLSILYKMFFIALSLFYLLRVNIVKFVISFGLLSFVLIWSLLHNFTGDLKFLLFDFGEGLKLFSTIVLFFTFSSFKYIDCKKHYMQLIIISLFVLFLNILASVVGFGYSSYENSGVGAKGFFYAANALSGVIVLIASFLLVKAQHKSIKQYILIFFLLFMLAAVIGTKSGILGVFLVASIIPIFRFRLSLNLVVGLLLLIPFVMYSFFYIYEWFLNSAFYERFMYFYDTGGLTRALLSDRDIFFWNIYPFYSRSDFITLLWGYGFSDLNTFPKALVEIDPIDMVFIFGVIPFITYTFLMSGIFKSIESISTKDLLISDLKLSVGVASFVMILISFVAGHILFNGIVTFLWGAVLALPHWRLNNLKKIQRKNLIRLL